MSLPFAPQSRQVRDLLAYSSTIVKASQDFLGAPWLEYDIHFRKQVATRGSPQWATIDASLWAMYFARANPKPIPGMSTKAGASGAGNDYKSQQNSARPRSRFSPYTPVRVCFRWNSRNGCQLVGCKFLHCCLRCRDSSHTALDCPQQRPNPPLPHPQEQLSRDTSFRLPIGRR